MSLGCWDEFVEDAVVRQKPERAASLRCARSIPSSSESRRLRSNPQREGSAGCAHREEPDGHLAARIAYSGECAWPCLPDQEHGLLDLRVPFATIAFNWS